MGKVALHKLSKKFGSVSAVKDVSLDIPDGAFVTLLGPSGCGKTTTLNMIAGLEKATSGDIYVDDECVTDWAPHERGIAMVFQNYALYPHMSVFENLAFSLRLKKVSRIEIAERVQAVAITLELDGLLERRPAQLSGGQQQRVALGRAMIKQPRVFLFDEPLSNLDAALRTRTRVEIKKLHQKVGATSIFVTHDQEEAMILSDYIAVMRDGVVVQYGTADSVYREPCNIYVAGFIGKPQMTLVYGSFSQAVTSGGLVFSNGALQLSWPVAVPSEPPLHGRTAIGIRAEDIEVVSDTEEGTNILRCEVTLLEPIGSDTFMEAVCGKIAFTVRVAPDIKFKLGEGVNLKFPYSKLHLFDEISGKRV